MPGKIQTFDSDWKPNGSLIPIWNETTEPDLRPAQVYVTTIDTGTRKGPHMHKARRGLFHCLSGRVLVRQALIGGGYRDDVLTPGDAPVLVSPGIPAALYNIGETEAIVLNLPNPAWTPENPDDWPVYVWEDPPDWRRVAAIDIDTKDGVRRYVGVTTSPAPGSDLESKK